MKILNIYFGLDFSADYPFDQGTCRRLAKHLYANPSTSPEEAIRLLQNSNLWSSMHNLCLTIDQLLCSFRSEIEKVSSIDDNINKPNFKKLLFDKNYSWIKVFSCPTPEEITEIAKYYTGISDTFLMSMVESIVIDENIPPQRIIDYLLKYSSLLSSKKTDSLLDCYNLKIAEINYYKQNQKNKQLKLPLR